MPESAGQGSEIFYHLIKLDEADGRLTEEIKENCNIDIETCMECGKCSGGCSSAHIFDFTPRKIIQLIKLGQEERLLHMDSLWTCVSCQLCFDRCPSNISVARIMDYLREKSHGKNIRPVRENVLMFHEIVLKSVEHSGRLNEIGSVMRFNLQSGRPFRDAGMGLRMFLRGKIRLLHFRIGNIRQVRRIFESCRTGGKIS